MSKYSELIQALELRAKNAAVDRLIAEYGPAGGNPNAKQSDHIEHIAAAALRELEAENERLVLENATLRESCDGNVKREGALRTRVAELEAEKSKWLADFRIQQDTIIRLREELAWYGEQARLARLIHSEGDAGRHALAADGGQRARAALEGK